MCPTSGSLATQSMAQLNANHPGLGALGSRPKLVLGTASTARRRVLAGLLADHGLAVALQTAAADIDERAVGARLRSIGDASALVTALAAAKADALVARLGPQDALLVTADQVVVSGGDIREKPGTPAQAVAWLTSYGTLPPSTVSGVAVTCLTTGERAVGVDVATVHFRPLSDSEAEGLVEGGGGAALGCAGALMVEGPAAAYITHVDGSLDSVFGMPVGLLLDLAAECAIKADGARADGGIVGEGARACGAP